MNNSLVNPTIRKILLFNSKAVAALLAFLITILSVLFTVIIVDIKLSAVISIAMLIFITSFSLTYLAMEFLFFREINRIYDILEKLRKKDAKEIKKKLKRSENVSPNVSPIARLNKELYRFVNSKEAEISQLKEMESYRREFLASISHELKTPIFAAQSYVHTLIDGAVDDLEVRDKFLKRAAKSLDGLQELVQDLMDLSEIEAGMVKMHFTDVNLGEMIEALFDLLEGVADKRDVQFHWERNSNKEVLVLADPKRIHQVMMNLIENGIKYGRDKGNIYVGMELEKDHIVVSVRDDGPGIEQEHLKRIFERFYRVEPSRNRSRGGSGLGLAIVKHIVEAHGSKVQVVSKMNRGTTFSFRLRRVKAEVPAASFIGSPIQLPLPEIVQPTAKK